MIIYDEPNEVYHANAAIGSGDIRAFLKSTQLFKDREEGVVVVKESPAMRFGTLTHMAILEPQRFKDTVAVKPEGHDGRTKEGKAWMEANAGKTMMSEAEAAQLHYMVERAPALVRHFLGGAKTEVTYRNDISGLSVQCRADAVAQSGTLLDLKTINDIDRIADAVWDHGYHIQQAWYQRIVGMEEGIYPPFKFLFVETQAPYRWRVVELDSDLVAMGIAATDKALAGIIRCRASGDWSDKSAIETTVSSPKWAAPQPSTGLTAKG